MSIRVALRPMFPRDIIGNRGLGVEQSGGRRTHNLWDEADRKAECGKSYRWNSPHTRSKQLGAMLSADAAKRPEAHEAGQGK